jgi:hypothetical protein
MWRWSFSVVCKLSEHFQPPIHFPADKNRSWSKKEKLKKYTYMIELIDARKPDGIYLTKKLIRVLRHINLV